MIPEAVGSGASLTLVDTAKADYSEKGPNARPPVLEKVDAVLGLDVHALLAQQIGAIQALSAQLKAVAKQNEALAKANKAISTQNQDLGHRIAALELAAVRQ